MLARRSLPNVRAMVVHDATELVDELAGCRRLIVVDACRSGSEVGSISQLHWPDPRISRRHRHSTHGLGIPAALMLAERLGRLPPEVQIIGVEVADTAPEPEMSRDALETMFAVEALLFDELSEVIHA